MNALTERPRVTLKVAMTLDGYVATQQGESKWITQEAARAYGHTLRSRHQGILIGRGTMRADNPQLTTRAVDGPSPRVCLLDTNAISAQGDRPAALRSGSILLHGSSADAPSLAQLASWGVHTHCLPLAPDHRGLDLGHALSAILSEGVESLLVEGGANVLGSFIAHGLFDELHVFVAPKVFGAGMPMLGTQAWSMADAPTLELVEFERLGADLHLHYVPAAGA